MKKIRIQSILTAIALCFCLMLVSVTKNSSAQPGTSISFQVFYDNLSPYGNWIYDGQYGYVWQPVLGGGFRPYFSDGYWVMTPYGSTWVSEYPWGWAPFHYGRWVYDPFYGWLWIPGSEWGPAWVCWRHGGGYYGWTPLGPGFGPGDWWGYNPPYEQWIFVNQGYVFNSGWRSHYYGPYVQNIFSNTTLVQNTYVNNNTTYIIGPRGSEIEKETKVKVPVYQISDNKQPIKTTVNGNTVAFYRPAVNSSGNMSGNKPAPKKFENAKQPILQPKKEGNASNNNKTVPNQVTPKQGAPNTNKTAPYESVTPVTKPKVQQQTEPKQTVPKQNAAPTPNQNVPNANAPAPKQSTPNKKVNPSPKQGAPVTKEYSTPKQNVPKQTSPQQKVLPPQMNNQPKQNQSPPKIGGSKSQGNKKDKPK